MSSIVEMPAPHQKPAVEVADILRAYLPGYLKERKLPMHHHKVLRAIMDCRTAALDMHAAQCDSCGAIEYSYNSCRNRHCPKCQGSAKLKWLGNRVEELLPIPYYHCVFTLPHLLNPLLRFNQKLLYDLFFQAASETFKEFAANRKWLGARIGFIGILHTWGQDLKYHVHLHFIVTGGGLSSDGKKWVAPKYETGFVFPVRAMSRVFRGKYVAGLFKYFSDEKLNLPGEYKDMRHQVVSEDFKRQLHKEEWVVYAKPPFGGPDAVLNYIGSYTHRVAISNHRIKSMDNGEVTFEYRDYRDQGVIKEMTLAAGAFIQRLLQHVVPERYVRIRYGGMFAGANREGNLRNARELLAARSCEIVGVLERLLRLANILLESSRRKCHLCTGGTMKFVEILRKLPMKYCWHGTELGTVVWNGL